MILKKTLAVVWVVMVIPATFFAAFFSSGFCDAPLSSQCSNGGTFDILWWALPILFIIGAIVGFRAKPTDASWVTVLLLLPIIPILFVFSLPLLFGLFGHVGS
jgi:hypothetical protein